MAGQLRRVAILVALVGAPAFAQQVDPNFQALLNALMQGTQVALLTPLADGMVQVTSFNAPGQRTAADAAALIERARLNLANFGVTQPTGQQLAVALAGGSLDLPTGRTQIAGVLPLGSAPATTSSQVVNTIGLPQVVAPLSPGGVASQAPGQAAAGGSLIVSPLPPSSTATPPNTPTPFLR